MPEFLKTKLCPNFKLILTVFRAYLCFYKTSRTYFTVKMPQIWAQWWRVLSSFKAEIKKLLEHCGWWRYISRDKNNTKLYVINKISTLFNRQELFFPNTDINLYLLCTIFCWFIIKIYVEKHFSVAYKYLLVYKKRTYFLY